MNGEFEIAGQKIPLWLIIATLGGIVLLVLLRPGETAPASSDGTGFALSEIDQRLLAYKEYIEGLLGMAQGPTSGVGVEPEPEPEPGIEPWPGYTYSTEPGGEPVPAPGPSYIYPLSGLTINPPDENPGAGTIPDPGPAPGAGTEIFGGL